MRARRSPIPLARAGVLLAAPLAAFGAAARTRLSDRAHVPTGVVSAPIAALLVVGGVAVVAALLALLRRAVHRRRSRDDEPVRVLGWTVSRRAQVAALLAIVALIAVPVWILVRIGGAAHSDHRTAPTTLPTSATSAGTAPPAGHHPGSGLSLTSALIVAAVLVGAGAIAVLAARAHRREPGLLTAPEESVELDRVLRVGLERGAAALDSTDDVRTAITRCYAALQHALDEAGLVRSPVRTPSELLSAAIDERLVAAAPATVLTRLFERARFSRDPLTDHDRDAARAALAGAEVITR